jgi:hypothetical protein
MFLSFFPEFLLLQHMIPLRQLELSEQIPDILLHRQKILFCGDNMELHFVVLEAQTHNTELRKLDVEWLLRAAHCPCCPRVVGRLCQTPTTEIAARGSKQALFHGSSKISLAIVGRKTARSRRFVRTESADVTIL